MDDYSEVNEFFDNDLSGPDGGNSGELVGRGFSCDMAFMCVGLMLGS